MTPPVLDRPITPVPAAVDLHLKDILSMIPSGRSGTLAGTVTKQGGEIAVGQRFGAGQISAWAGTEWGTGAWSAGVGGGFSWR